MVSKTQSYTIHKRRSQVLVNFLCRQCCFGLVLTVLEAAVAATACTALGVRPRGMKKWQTHTQKSWGKAGYFQCTLLTSILQSGESFAVSVILKNWDPREQRSLHERSLIPTGGHLLAKGAPSNQMLDKWTQISNGYVKGLTLKLPDYMRWDTPTHGGSRGRVGRRDKQQKTQKGGDLGGIWWFDGLTKE